MALIHQGFDPLKAFLSFLLACFSVSAATPSFNSFEPTQFATNNLRVSLQEPLVVTNLYSSNIFVTNIIANTIYTTNIYATNLYVTNIYNDITFNGRVTFNTNVTFVTNVVGAVFGAAGWFNGINLITNISFPLLSAGITDLITVPSGYRFSVIRVPTGTTNLSGVSTTFYIKTNAVYYPATLQATVVTNQGTDFAGSIPILEGGEILAVSNSVGGVNCIISGYFYTNTYPLFSPRVFGLAAADNVIYVCPTNKIAKASSTLTPQHNILNAPNCLILNRYGATITIRQYLTLTGEPVGDGNIYNYRTIPANTVVGFATPGFFTEGNSYTINSDTASDGIIAWITVYEDNE